MHRFPYRFLCLIALSATTVSAAFAQKVSFSQTSTNDASELHADFNSDGREDFVGLTANCAATEFAVTLSTGDGSYATPTCYALPSGTPIYYAIGDFNNDGNADVIVSNATKSFYEYLGSATGTLHLQATLSASNTVNEIAAADVNHDGLVDLLMVCDSCGTLQAWFSNGSGFTTGPTTSVAVAGFIFTGDFDGDGKADVFMQTTAYGTTDQVLYGNGNGTFVATAAFGGNTEYVPFDVNGDGAMDLIGAPNDFSINGSTYYNYLNVLYGTTARTFTSGKVNLANCTVGPLHPTVGDFNGDGINDIAVVEGADCKGDGPDTFNVLLGSAKGFQPEQVIDTSDVAELANPDVLRLNQDSNGDLELFDITTGEFPTANLFQNTTSGNFPSCYAPNHYTGITMCSPTSTVVASSPVTFNLGAANQTQGRKAEVWVDGKKLGENLKDAFSHYSFFDKSFALTNGTHQVTVFAAGWDNLLQKFSFPLTVGSSTCAPPASPGLNICSPLANSTLGTSVLAWAGGTVNGAIGRMEVWVDGVKKYSTFKSNTLQTTLNLAPGAHKFDYYVVSSTGTTYESTVYATVQ